MSRFTGTALTVPTNGTVVGWAAAATGAEIKRYDVLATPWGQLSVDTGTVVRFRMGSQEFDQEIGLYHLGARYYDPSMGRFLSEDPSGIAGGLNLYAYAGNDPVQGTDPTGLCPPGWTGPNCDIPVMPPGPPGVGTQSSCPPGAPESGAGSDCGTNERTCGYTMDYNCTPGTNNNSVNDTLLASASSNDTPQAELARMNAECRHAEIRALSTAGLDFLALWGVGQVAKAARTLRLAERYAFVSEDAYKAASKAAEEIYDQSTHLPLAHVAGVGAMFISGAKGVVVAFPILDLAGALKEEINACVP